MPLTPMPEEPTIKDVLANVQDVLETMHSFSSNMDKQLKEVNEKLDTHSKQINELRSDVAVMRSDVNKTRSEMATKDYIDRRLDNLEVNLGTKTKDLDKKDSALVNKLAEKKIVSQDEQKEIVSMSPFPQILG